MFVVVVVVVVLNTIYTLFWFTRRCAMFEFNVNDD